MKRLVWSLMLVALSMAPALQAQGPAFGKPLDPDDPLGDLESRMKSITGDLDGKLTGKKVQDKQQDVITQLDKLIEELQKQSGS